MEKSYLTINFDFKSIHSPKLNIYLSVILILLLFSMLQSVPKINLN